MSDRLDRIEQILESVASRQAQAEVRQAEAEARQTEFGSEIDRRLAEMAARQQYHDGARERMDATVKEILAAIAQDAENIRALVRIAEIRERRLSHLEGDATT